MQQIDLAAWVNHCQSVIERPQRAGRKIYRYEDVFNLHNSSFRRYGDVAINSDVARIVSFVYWIG